ncbi:hypothetical protein Droror1_Dr00025752 [Drosera rotundifolia]
MCSPWLLSEMRPKTLDWSLAKRIGAQNPRLVATGQRMSGEDGDQGRPAKIEENRELVEMAMEKMSGEKGCNDLEFYKSN